MTWVTGVVLYILLWWTALFAVLPLGTRPVEQPDEDSGWRGVPERPRILMKVIVTTVVASVLWLAVWWVISSDYLSFRDGILSMPK